MAQTYSGTLTGIGSIQVNEKAPLDVRTVVNNLSDLTTKWVEGGEDGIQNLYTGIVVYVKENQSLYVLKGAPKNCTDINSWFKVGGEIDLSNYATLEDIANFLTASDLDEYVKADDIKDFITEDALTDLVSKSDLEGYVKTEDIVDYLTASDAGELFATKAELIDYAKIEDIPDVSNFATKDELVDFLTASDVEDYVKVDDIKDFITAEALTDLVEKSDLEGYVKTEDAVEFLTSSDAELVFATKSELADYALRSELPTVPTNVSAFTNDAGYLTQHQDLSAYATKSELPTEGVFPDVDGSDASDTGIDGFATIDGVVEYVNVLFEKKKARRG